MKQPYILMLLSTLLFSCDSEKKDRSFYDYNSETVLNTDTTKRSNETFNRVFFNSMSNSAGSLTQDDGYTYIYMSSSDNQASERISQKDSYYSSLKFYYPTTDRIKEEGMTFTSGGWQMGVWKFYDEEGMLTHTIDYDAPFTFSLESMMKYAERRGYEIEKGYRNLRTSINRFFRDGHPFWMIIDSGEDGMHVKEITFDGKTGKETGRKKYIMTY